MTYSLDGSGPVRKGRPALVQMLWQDYLTTRYHVPLYRNTTWVSAM